MLKMKKTHYVKSYETNEKQICDFFVAQKAIPKSPGSFHFGPNYISCSGRRSLKSSSVTFLGNFFRKEINSLAG
jgi:hypothetical protein